ncbi:MAG: ABC transporter ATP-binding protein [Lachnospiraceae bacterium]|nr:ABC transporter ATP-binding protein [Lachnospiraceae bacterium]
MKKTAESEALFASFYRNNRPALAISALFYALLAVVETPLIAWILAKTVDTISTGSYDALLGILPFIALFVVAEILCSAVGFRAKALFVHRGLRQYKNRAFSLLSGKKISAFSSVNTGSYLSLLTNDIQSIEEDYLSRGVTLLYQILRFALALGMMLYYSPLMTLFVVLFSIFPILVSALMGKGLAVRTQRVSGQNESFTTRLKDLLSGFSVIKSFKAEAPAGDLFQKENNTLEDIKQSRRWYELMLGGLSNAAAGLMQFGVFFAGAWLAIAGSITAGTVLLFVQLCNGLIEPIGTVPQLIAARKAAKGLIYKCAGMIAPDSKDKGLPVPQQLREGIALNALSYAYDENAPVLRDVTQNFLPGKSYALVGASGSGKSTLLQLLMGSCEGYEGSLTVDGTELQEADHDSLYDLVSLIDQNVFLFDDTIRQNITMFSDFDEALLQDVMRKAALDEVIAEHGEAYLCGENGSRLSGGERQRVAIARALLRGTKVLLVDEATSALDAETAVRINEMIASLQGLTRIVVTHRLEKSALEQFDEILVMRDGSIVEKGRYADLMEQKGQFYALSLLAA